MVYYFPMNFLKSVVREEFSMSQWGQEYVTGSEESHLPAYVTGHATHESLS